MLTRVDDLWLASFLMSCGATLARVCVIPYRNGRLTAVFELEGTSEDSITQYTQADPSVKVHDLRTAMNQLRDAMHAELSANNYQTKSMPNNGGHRRYGNGNRAVGNR
jgi:hypothetical protein